MDKKLIYSTDVIKEISTISNFYRRKNMLHLAYKYRLIDQDYKLAVLNDVLCNVEYQPDGSSATM